MTAPPGKGEQILSVGQMYLPFTIDAQDAWDSASNNMLLQVVEGIYAYDYADPALPKVPRLAAAMGTWDSTYHNYTVNLKQGVTFHDGSTFNADDVVFSWKRQQWLYNFTGLNNGYVPDVYELYAWPDHLPIIKEVHKVSDYQVIYELNRVYGPFEDLLCYMASSILTDTYYNETGGIVDLDGDVIGTGPFMYDSYEEDVEVIMLAYDDYHRGRAKLDKLIYVGIISAQARTAALFAGDINYLYQPMDEMWSSIEGAAGLTLWAPEDRVSSGVNYMSMNCEQINRTWREALSYAYNYEYQIDTLRYGHGTRLKSPIGVGIKYHNGTQPAPIFNLTYAREVVQSMGFGVGFNVSEDDEWTTATADNPFLTLNYSYNIGNDVREKTFIMVISNYARIGVRVTDAGSTWSIVLQKLYELG
ncbi:MAG: ABC transporter substrate-binding protein, partial [Promethearchaeota archaeon]